MLNGIASCNTTLKYALASNSIKTQLAYESKSMSQQLCMWQAFPTSFF
jgi:hypothetical protein